MSLKVKFKKLNEKAVVPTKASKGAACFDLVATSERIDIANKYLEYGTGLALEIPEGYVGRIYPRSSNSNKDIVLANSVGTVDEDYRGEIFIRFKNLNTIGVRKYNVGDRVAQLSIEEVLAVEFEETKELADSTRGSGGFGSTGS